MLSCAELLPAFCWESPPLVPEHQGVAEAGPQGPSYWPTLLTRPRPAHGLERRGPRCASGGQTAGRAAARSLGWGQAAPQPSRALPGNWPSFLQGEAGAEKG